MEDTGGSADMNDGEIADGLLTKYRRWSFAAIGSFLLFVSLLSASNMAGEMHFEVLIMAMAAGFGWIGATSLSRHTLVVLKRHIAREMRVPEFLSTQLVIILFPFTYGKVKREVGSYKLKLSAEGK